MHLHLGHVGADYPRPATVCRRRRNETQIRLTVDFDTTGPSNASSNAPWTSRTDSPRRKETITNASYACVRVTPLPTISLANSSRKRCARAAAPAPARPRS